MKAHIPVVFAMALASAACFSEQQRGPAGSDAGPAPDPGSSRPDPGPDPWTSDASAPGPCLELSRDLIDFEGVMLGQQAVLELEVRSCGDAPLEIREVSLLTDEEAPDVALSQEFALDLGPDLAAGLPLLVAPGESVVIRAQYTPEEAYPGDEHGDPAYDRGLLRIRSNTAVPERLVELRGFGIAKPCPIPIITVEEGTEVVPHTLLHLDATQSFSEAGSITKYEWTVEQPAGSQSMFIPSPSYPQPTFQVDVIGLYIFRLRVWDDSGHSCADAQYQVLVSPGTEVLTVELTWSTPGDADETDAGEAKGADLDLHFTHPNATGPDLDQDGVPDPWFDEDYDCFWHNTNPNWEDFDPEQNDDPVLERDDSDGAGPETLSMEQPTDGRIYRVGVHYWDDHGYGDSLATVRIFCSGALAFEAVDVQLAERDMWEVATIGWPGCEVTPLVEPNGGHRIHHDYVNPFFFQP